MAHKIKSIIITPETHWDREWYLPFEGYRAKLIILFDRLIDIIESNPDYTNWCFDGQTVPIQDYLEVRPEKREILKKIIQEGKISLGPMYILPDEYLVSGEALIRNFMLGHKITEEFGKVMNSAYIPDPFGHIAQLPQIIAGFELPTVLCARGFGNEFEELNLDMEFNWDSPGTAASVIMIHLIKGYGSVAYLPDGKNKDGIYDRALQRIESVSKELSEYSATGVIILNNGSDHLLAQPHIPDVVKQWNKLKSSEYAKLIQADFGEYSKQIIEYKDKLKHYSGELHGGKYSQILSGVFSARMWIKQENWEIQTLLERYAEPFSILNFILTKEKFQYPTGILWAAWQKLLRNHPHDSICGCSIDEVHDIDMKARFFQSKEMTLEIIKENIAQISTLIDIDDNEGERFGFLVFNPLFWKRTELSKLNVYIQTNIADELGSELKLTDSEGNEYPFSIKPVEVEPRYRDPNYKTFEILFVAKDIPAFGYKLFYLYPGEEPEYQKDIKSQVEIGENWLKNQYYKIEINKNGTFSLEDLETSKKFTNLAYIENMGDWGDEYDYSGPKEHQKETLITSKESEANINIIQTDVNASAEISINLKIPHSLNEPERLVRSNATDNTEIKILVELPLEEKLVKINVYWENKSLDHRIRLVFPSSIVSDEIQADGHFYVIPRKVDGPDDHDWHQKWVPTHHQNKFVTISDSNNSFTVMNKGLPEYEAIKGEQGEIEFAITMLRSMGWLSRGDLATRKGNAGPSLYTPGAQCLGSQSCELAITTAKQNWLNSDTYRISEEFNAPLLTAVPQSINESKRIMNGINIGMGSTKKIVYETDSEKLPETLSFLNLDNHKLIITALKKAENDNCLVLRILNLSHETQIGELTTYKPIDTVKIVNYNEKDPINPIKAKIIATESKCLKIELNPYVLATFKISFK
jgi:2-O-(6-phospho-alpha-D-mannosyl)-D-glycerate hydrolase